MRIIYNADPNVPSFADGHLDQWMIDALEAEIDLEEAELAHSIQVCIDAGIDPFGFADFDDLGFDDFAAAEMEELDFGRYLVTGDWSGEVEQEIPF